MFAPEVCLSRSNGLLSGFPGAVGKLEPVPVAVEDTSISLDCVRGVGGMPSLVR